MTTIRRIEYANRDVTRTAVVVACPWGAPWRLDDRWKVYLGDRARADADVRYARTMTQCQAWAREWVEGRPIE